MAVNELVYKGVTYTALRSASGILSESLPLSALPVDTLRVVVVDEAFEHTEDLLGYSYGDVVLYYHDGALVGKFYLENIIRTGRIDWSFSCISPIGLLLTDYHYGNVYTGETASEVLADIIKGIIPYTLDTTLGKSQIYGWLPKATRRDNLRNLLFAIGARAVKDANGDTLFIPYSDNPPYAIDGSKFYLSNNSVEAGTPATQAMLTEHAYFILPNDEEVTLFNGEAIAEDIVTPKGDPMSGIIVTFEQPMHDLSVTGGTILESGVNYAVLAGSSYVQLTGKKYTHTERIVSKTITTQGVKNVVSSNDCHLINFMNSDSVAERLISFYGYSKRVTADMIISGEKPGDKVTFVDPYGEEDEGYIESLNLSMSKELKATVSIVSGFIPPHEGGLFTREAILTGSGEFTIPDGVRIIRFVLFSGAQGGKAGKAGTAAGAGKTHSYSHTSWISGKVTSRGEVKLWSDGGKGGPGGEGGLAPLIFEGRMTVKAGQKITYSCGVGGTGAIFNAASPDTPGADGTETTFGDQSSNSGSRPSVAGWVDILTGEIYARPGPAGLPGGDAAKFPPDYTIPDNSSDLNEVLKFVESTAATDEDGGVWPGGVTRVKEGTTDVAWWKTYATNPAGNAGSFGGYTPGVGGAAGAVAPADVKGSQSVSNTRVSAYAANGQKGGTPTLTPKKPGLTMGGRGGYGGGGGGVPGWAAYETNPSEFTGSASASAGSAGPGGDGGPGGPGGDGMIIVYY